MKPILKATIASTLAELIEQYSVQAHRPKKIEAWVFAELATRQEAERALAEFGIEAKVRSAYKPLVHYFLEEFFLDERFAVPEDLVRVEIRYPICAPASDKRFLLEAYPLAGLIDPSKLVFTSGTQADRYELEIYRSSSDGAESATVSENVSVFVPNHTYVNATQDSVLTPTGWVKAYNHVGELERDERLATDFERCFSQMIDSVTGYEWPIQSPYFKQLQLKVQMPVEDELVGYAHEVISLKEALHEDLYFSIQEWFKFKEGKALTARSSQPGQIVPLITASPDSDYHLEMTLVDYSLVEVGVTDEESVLDVAAKPMSMTMVQQHLATVSGEALAVDTPTGRQVEAKYKRGKDQAVLICGGQHANETTGVVGALRAAKVLEQQEESHFVVVPMSNPDGYALHQQYIQDNPLHMHHAARYTALGDDLEYRTVEPLYEKGMRKQARQLSGANLHINLHGYPSHEWTRPLSGYVPTGFDMWTIPKGFFLVVRHLNDPQWARLAEQFIEQVTLKLNVYPEVMAMNQAQIDVYQIHAGETGFRMINGYPCLISAVEEADYPLQLITEYPDETIYGDDFIAGHKVQQATVLAAYEVYQSLLV